MENSTNHKKWMMQAVAEALTGVRAGDGGPFGAIIVKDDHQVVAEAHNRVISSHDPTAHAEIEAIRMASRQLGRFDLSDCVIYSSCEPCPMCFAAIYWARISKVYYACSSADAAQIGFDDQQIYDILRGVTNDSQLIMEQIFQPEHLEPMREWESSPAKKPY